MLIRDARFDALVKDLFPTANMAEIEYAVLSDAIKEVYEELKLVYMPTQVCPSIFRRFPQHYCKFVPQVRKILEFYEQLRQRMGVVIVGPSGSGKTTLWRLDRSSTSGIILISYR